jgi:hypothetical protein
MIHNTTLLVELITKKVKTRKKMNEHVCKVAVALSLNARTASTNRLYILELHVVSARHKYL